jgi:hypothetical protein
MYVCVCVCVCVSVRYDEKYRMIRLRCHKKKWKRCRKKSALLPVNSTYTCRRDTTQHDLHGGRGTVHTARTSFATWRAAFPEWSVQRPRWSSVGDHLHSVVFVCTQVTWRILTRKSLGNSRAMGWAHHGRTRDFCMCRLKTPTLWEPNVAEPYKDILPAHIQTNYSEVRTLSSYMHRFTFLTSETDHPVIQFGALCSCLALWRLNRRQPELSAGSLQLSVPLPWGINIAFNIHNLLGPFASLKCYLIVCAIVVSSFFTPHVHRLKCANFVLL